MTLSTPALPFVGSTGSRAPEPSQTPARSPHWTGTEDVDLEKLRGLALPFGPSTPQKSVPSMNVERYAELRAELAVHGELHAPTWARFGIHSGREKEELQRRFADHFRADPAAQKDFVELVRVATAKVATTASRVPASQQSTEALRPDSRAASSPELERPGDKSGAGRR
jgi:hypothetical protein